MIPNAAIVNRYFPIGLAGVACYGEGRHVVENHHRTRGIGVVDRSSAGRWRVTLSPGDDIQQAVDSNPPGTTFMLNAGVYRIQSVLPKKGDAFIGAVGVVLNGAKLLDTFDRDGALYVARNQPIDPGTVVHGVLPKGLSALRQSAGPLFRRQAAARRGQCASK